MLEELYIRNLALIEEARIPFGPGLTILTGETGAGKSIILDALSLLLGGRASTDFVRSGTERATLEAVFSVWDQTDSNKPVLQGLFEEAGIDWMADDTILVARDLLANGKTVCRINGRIVTVNFLKHIGAYLVDIAGQHENQTLLRPEEHLKMIDRFGGNEISEFSAWVASLYQSYQQAKKHLNETRVGEQERALRMDMLRFQLQEIESLGLKPAEEEQLENESKRLAHAEKLHGITQSLYAGLYDGEGRVPAILDRLASFKSELAGALRIDPSLQSAYELLQTAQVQLEEVAVEIRGYRENIEFNPDRLAQMNDRLAAIRKLKRKYGDSIPEILAYAQQIREELTRLENHEEHLESLQQEVLQTGKRLADACLKLSQKRKAVSEQVCELIRAGLAQLMMPKTQITAAFHEQSEADGLPVGERTVHVSELGIDRVEFLFSPNEGEAPRSLAKIASGGELSRILLTWKSIMAGSDGVQTLVFDEIDTGISGRAAQAVAERMGTMARDMQVMVVTHLPQVACMADTHLQIFKEEIDGRVTTFVERLSDENRVEVLARMLSGAELTETSRRAAEEMLRLARLVKAS